MTALTTTSRSDLLALGRSLIVGAILGFVETLLTFSTGFATTREVLYILSGDVAFALVCWLLTLAGVGLLGSLGRAGSPQTWIQLCLLLAPVVLFALRGNVDPNQVSHEWTPLVRWGLPAFIAVAVVVHLHRRVVVQREELDLARFTLLSLLAQLCSGVAFALRTIDLVATRDIVLAGLAERALFSTALAAAAVLACWIWARTRPWATIAAGAKGTLLTGLGFVLLAIVVAAQLGVRPPRLRTPTTPSRGAEARPSVLLIVLDTVRRDHMSVYGYQRKTTPRLEQLASEALVFERAYASATYSLSSHASLFTGLLPSLHGAHPVPRGSGLVTTGNAGHFRVSDRVTTLADELRGRGYWTAAISANDIFLADWTGLQRGFQAFACEARRSYRYVPLVMPVMHKLGAEEAFPYHAEWSAEEITESAIAALGALGRQPFFLFLNYFDAHAPYLPPAPFDRLFPAESPDETSQALSRYDAEIFLADRAVGRLLDWMRGSGLLERTIVVITSDHGEYFGEHGLRGHSDELYEQVLSVPLLVRLAGPPSAERRMQRVGLFEIRGMIRAALAGDRSLGLGSGEAPRVLAESWRPVHGGAPVVPGFRGPRSRAVYFENWKLVERVNGVHSLFDLAADPEERWTLFSTKPSQAAAVYARIRAGLATAGAVHDESGGVPLLDAQAIERLRSLGYTSGGEVGVPTPSPSPK